MDKNSIIGLLLIGGILVTFGILNKPSDDEVDVVNNQDKKEIVLNETESKTEESTKMIDTLTQEEVDTLGMDSTQVQQVESVTTATEKIVNLSNGKVSIDVSTFGAGIKSAFLPEYKTYKAYIDSLNEPLQLFDEESVFGIEFVDGKSTLNTSEFNYEVVEKSDDYVKLAHSNGAKSITVTYRLTPDSYDVDYQVAFDGYDNQSANQAALVADFKLLATEKNKKAGEQHSAVYYDDEGSYAYLKGADDDYTFEERSNWIAFKQIYFSTIIMSEGGFANGSTIAMKSFEETEETYVKDYSAHLNLGMNQMSDPVHLTWYIGPNDYDVLAAHDNGIVDILDLGWGLFRWINKFLLRPVFKLFINWGVGAGIAILLMTILVKIVLSPVNYKMYKSSAMMKVLKPEIAEITAKYPKKEDAMKKQQELMALYNEAGASPMAGCVPMLFQMPILFAIFRLFPSAMELRQKSFLWAEDLSTYDSIFNLPFDIPFYGSHVSLFTLLMAGTTLLYTHYNGSGMEQPQQEGMPNMKVIMYFFPIMMIFFFNNYSSGLSFYYFISTLMTMIIMFSIKKFILDDKKIHAKIAANKANPKKKKGGKSKFSQRLEEAQRMQQEQMKNKKK